MAKATTAPPFMDEKHWIISAGLKLSQYTKKWAPPKPPPTNRLLLENQTLDCPPRLAAPAAWRCCWRSAVLHPR
jgi:hypothetical protein